METLLLIISYYIAGVMVMSIYSGFKSDPIWVTVAVVWPFALVLAIMALLWLCLYYFFRVFYKFGEMFK